MKTIRRRLYRLEDQFGSQDKPRDRFRLVISRVGREVGLASATCRRTIWPNGTLFEMVRLNGSNEGNSKWTAEELDRWIRSYPIL